MPAEWPGLLMRTFQCSGEWLEVGPHLLSITNVAEQTRKQRASRLIYRCKLNTDPRAPPVSIFFFFRQAPRLSHQLRHDKSSSPERYNDLVKAGSPSWHDCDRLGVKVAKRRLVPLCWRHRRRCPGRIRGGWSCWAYWLCFFLRRKRRERKAYEEKRHMDLIAPRSSAHITPSQSGAIRPAFSPFRRPWPPTAGSLPSGG